MRVRVGVGVRVRVRVGVRLRVRVGVGVGVRLLLWRTVGRKIEERHGGEAREQDRERLGLG